MFLGLHTSRNIGAECVVADDALVTTFGQDSGYKFGQINTVDSARVEITQDKYRLIYYFRSSDYAIMVQWHYL